MGLVHCRRVWRGCGSAAYSAEMSDNNAAVADHLFSDARLAALYDLFCAGRKDFDFYLPQIMAAQSVLDIGCGTGALLHLARDNGHAGRLCGLDPAPGMLEQARRRGDIEWVLGDLSTKGWQGAFELAVMTGHAFQVLLDDADIRAALDAVRAALVPGGCFAFETRNPLKREWERWTTARPAEVTDGDGTVVRLSRAVQTPVVGERVSFTHTFTSPSWDRPQTSQSTLRFVSMETLARLLGEAGYRIEAQFGDWDASPLTAASTEIITFARPI